MLAKFEDDVSGVVKADGTASLEIRPLKGSWGCLLVIAQTTNPAAWTVLVNGSVNAIGKGSRTSLGPVLIEPGDKVQLLVLGANPGSNVTGHLVGTQSEVGWHELPIPPPLPNTITSETVPPPGTLYFGGLFGVTAGVEVTKTITVPLGAKNLLLLAGDFNTPNMYSHIKVGSVAGVGANRTYFETFAPNQPFYVVPIFPADMQLLIAITTTAANPTAGFAVFVAFDSLSDLQTLWHSVPAPWQAPSASVSGVVNLISGGSSVLVSGINTQRLYLFNVTVYSDGGPLEVRLIDGKTAPNIVGVGNAGARGLVFSHDYQGAAPFQLGTGPLNSDRDLKLSNAFGPTANFQYTLEYSQAA